MTFSKTERGFSLFEFTDRYGQKCSLQESSLAEEACAWCGVDVDLNGKEVNNRMHLTQEMALRLSELLYEFAISGEVSEIIGLRKYERNT